ncbi:MAG: TPM domain-containing protein [Verrucomicrobiota bacterium]|nr:TPM domain-containing protein [Verrucomicrobiota bacterium]
MTIQLSFCHIIPRRFVAGLGSHIQSGVDPAPYIMENPILKCALFLSLLLGLTEASKAQIRFPEQPGERTFITDEAGLLSTATSEKLRAQLTEVLQEKAIPIIIASIGSIYDYGAGDMSIETYARILYDEWGIGHRNVRVNGPGLGRSEEIEWNKGILLLVAVDDRKARIELGAGFGRQKDALCRNIMSQHIIPRFKTGDYEGGIVAGTRALSQMALGEKIEAPPRPLWHYGLLVLGIILTVFTIVSLARRGSSGWAWVFWAAVMALLWAIIYGMLTSRGSGFGGGSFGGGFSGGGGATGSW